jgi:hypothetical protein
LIAYIDQVVRRGVIAIPSGLKVDCGSRGRQLVPRTCPGVGALTGIRHGIDVAVQIPDEKVGATTVRYPHFGLSANIRKSAPPASIPLLRGTASVEAVNRHIPTIEGARRISEREHTMGITAKTTKLAATALAAVTVLLLAGCSAATKANNSGIADGAPPAGIFEFQTNVYGSEGELTIRIPDSLVKAAGSDAEGLLVGQVTANALELASSKFCAVDLEVDYRGDGLDVLAKPSMTEQEYDEMVKSELEYLLDRKFGVSTVEEAKAENPAEYVDEMMDYVGSGKYEATPAWGLLNATPVADLDLSDPQSGRYISDDLRTLTFVQHCATSPNDDETSDEFGFPVQADGEIGTFASVEINVMKNGTLGLIEAGVSDYERDSNGDWIGG